MRSCVASGLMIALASLAGSALAATLAVSPDGLASPLPVQRTKRANESNSLAGIA